MSQRLMSLTLAFCLLLAALPIMNTSADSPVDITALEYAQDWVDSNATDYGQQSFNLSEVFNVSAGGLGWSDDDFVCHNGNTTSASSVNNGSDDCGDGSDENNANCWNMTWPEDAFHAAVYAFVAEYVIKPVGSDGIYGAAVGCYFDYYTNQEYSDVADELENSWTGTANFLCDNGNEILVEFYDDGNDDCGDWSDEPGVFVCDNGQNISALYVNDGDNDCGDWSDEDGGYFTCDNGQNISALYVNDGDNDCGDWSDEDGDKFVCDNGNEIPLELYDNAIDDCGDGSDEDGSNYFTCADGETIQLDWVDDGWCDCEDGSDEPDGFDCDDTGGGEEDDEMGFGIPTGMLGDLIDMEGDNLTEEVAINFITPHAADIQISSSLNLDAETANVLRQDIIIASKMSEIEAYFVEGKVDIAAAYAAGEADGEETITAYMSLYENATLSVFPDFNADNDSDNDGFSDMLFNTAEDLRDPGVINFDEVVITQQHLDTYYDVAWGDGMNNMLTMDMAITFGIFIGFMLMFAEEPMSEDDINATFLSFLTHAITNCPDAPSAIGVMGCIMTGYSSVIMDITGSSGWTDEYDADDFTSYCLDLDNHVLTAAGQTISGGGCTDSVQAFYNMSDEENFMTMDGVEAINLIDLVDQPGGFPSFWPGPTITVGAENVLGNYFDNYGKTASAEIGMQMTVFFPGVSAGDNHTFAIGPEDDDEFFQRNVQVSPPSGYAFGEGSEGDVITMTGSEDEAITWTFVKSADDSGEELEDSGLPGPGLLVVVLTIFGVASLRRRF